MNWHNFTPFFQASEFECKCGCGKNNMSESFLRTLYLLRREANQPFIINSGCRCEKHNALIGGSSTSAHLTGQAVDIRCETSGFRYVLLSLAHAFKISRIGLSKSFIHLDTATHLPQDVTWFY